jgi:CheY-like chemotaxis protein
MRTILIVDDEYGISEIIGDLLSSHGFNVMMAMNGKLALAAMAQTRPDVILLDVMMPVMTGPEMLHALKASDEYRDIPVVMMSAVGRRALTPAETPLIAGFLAKPFTYDELISVLQQAVGDGA